MNIKSYLVLIALLFGVVAPVCCKEKVIYYNYSRNKDDTLDQTGGPYPAQKLIDLIHAHPRARYFRLDWQMSSMTNIQVNVLLDRKKQILKYHTGAYTTLHDKGDSQHLLFRYVTVSQLQRAVFFIKNTKSKSVDVFLFLLAKVGCHVTDLQKKKRLFWDSEGETLSYTRS